MANLLNANLPSDDEEDADFVPDEVDSDDEAARKSKQKKKAKRQRGVAAAHDEDSGGDDDEPPPPKAIPEHKRLEKKAKMDDLWSKLNQGMPGAAKACGPVVGGGGGGGVAALCKPASKQGKPGANDAWMRQLGLGSIKSKAAASGGPVDRRAAAAAALAAAKSAASATAGQQYGMVTVTETRRFAGQTITVQREVQADSKQAAKAAAAAPAAASAAAAAGAGPSSSAADPAAAAAAAKKKAGLDAVLASLAQTKKVSVLDKTRSDWKEFKRGDDDVDEELEAHKRSGAGFLERQAFLGRAEVAQYERERDQRLGSDMRNRGRL
jgi:hypothetical protein